MVTAVDIVSPVFKNFSATPVARVTKDGAGAPPIVQADISAIEYTIYLIDDHDEDNDTAVTGHTAVDLTSEKSSIIFDTLQTPALDARWTRDPTGYNFKHVLDVSTNQAFLVAGRRYRIVYTLTPTSGQEIPVRFIASVE